jgi:hypothetical protein
MFLSLLQEQEFVYPVILLKVQLVADLFIE